MKKSRISRVISLTVGASLMLSGFTLVSPSIVADETESSEASDSATSESVIESSSDATESETKAEKKEHKVIKILAPESGVGKFKLADREEYPVWGEFQKLLDQYNLELDLEIINKEQYKNTIQTRLNSSVDLPEFANVASVGISTISRMGEEGMIKNIADLPNLGDGTSKEFFTNGRGKESWILNTFEDGAVYWISQIQQNTYQGRPDAVNMCAQIRKDWLEKVNREVPKSTDELFDTLMEFQKQDVNENGIKDEFITIDLSSFDNGIAQWFGLVNSLTGLRFEGDKASDIVSPWHQEHVKEYFNFLRKLHENGLIDPTVIGSTEDNKNVENNKASMVFNYTMATWNEAKMQNIPAAMFVNIGPIDAGTNDTSFILNEPPNMSYGQWAFTSVANDDEKNARLLDVLCTDKYAELTYLGIEGQTYEMKDGRPVLLPIAQHDAYDEAYNKKIVIGDYLWANGNCFPKRRYWQFESTMESNRAAYPEKVEDQERLIDYPNIVPTDKSVYLPVATREQMEIISSHMTDLNTRSSEIAASLILGEEDMENFDSLVAELDDLGLQEMIEIDQSRLDRAKEMGLIK